MKYDWFALGSFAFLISVFVVSYVLLQKTIRNSNRPLVSSETSNDRRNLTEEERLRIARRMEREVLREQREMERIRQRDAFESAKPSAYSEKIRKREEERLSREAEQMRVNQERERQEAAVYEKWRSQIQITENGQDDQVIGENIVDEFIQSISSGIIVLIEDLALRFGISSQQVVARIREIEKQRGLIGCFDDRGRYIPITNIVKCRVDENLKGTTARIATDSIQIVINDSIRSKEIVN